MSEHIQWGEPPAGVRRRALLFLENTERWPCQFSFITVVVTGDRNALACKWFVELLKMDFDAWLLLSSFEKPGITGHVGRLRIKHPEKFFFWPELNCFNGAPGWLSH